MSNITTLKVGDHQVKIEAGELVGYQVSGHEFMHQKNKGKVSTLLKAVH